MFAISDPFCYLLTGGERVEALWRVHIALKPAGIVLLDGPNFLEATWTHYDRFTITQGAGKQTVCDEHRFAMLSPPEVMTTLRTTGFAKLQTFSDYDSRASERVTGPRMMVAAQRPE